MSGRTEIGPFLQSGFLWKSRVTPIDDSFGNPVYLDPVPFDARMEDQTVRGDQSSQMRDQITGDVIHTALIICPFMDGPAQPRPYDQIVAPDGTIYNIMMVDGLSVEHGTPHHLEMDIAEER